MARKNKHWTIPEIRFIENNYATMSQKELATKFNVTVQVIDCVIKRYGLRKKDKVGQQGIQYRWDYPQKHPQVVNIRQCA